MRETTTTTTTGHDTESSPEPNYRPTIGDVDHTNPHTDAPFGAAIAYKRGPRVAADGGERDAVEAPTGAEADELEAGMEGEEADERMRDVDHAPPDRDEVNRVHERGGEGQEER